jgi:hypothetical protein
MTIRVCGPKDDPVDGELKLSVSSRSPVFNPSPWKDLWLLSPFSIVPGGVEVPGLPGVRSKTVENDWQFLKVWQEEGVWNRDEALAAFASDCAIRFPRGQHPKVLGSWWDNTSEILSYVDARIRIYMPTYLQMLQLPDRLAVIQRLRDTARDTPLVVWDFDSYDYAQVGLPNMFETVLYELLPFAHAFLVAMAVNRELDDFFRFIGMSTAGKAFSALTPFTEHFGDEVER